MADAVVIPGGMFGPGAGMLMYAGATAARRGATVHRYSWSTQRPDPSDPTIESWVRGEVGPLLDAIGGSPLLIAKSLGVNAASLAVERSLPAVWLTPALVLPWIAEALRRATAPFLLVGGTGDDVWDGAQARRLSPETAELRRRRRDRVGNVRCVGCS